MGANLTVSELRKAGAVTNTEIDAAVDAYLGDRDAKPFPFAGGHAIDVGAAVDAHRPAKLALVDDDRPPKFKRNMVRTAILLAHPVKG